MLSDLDKTEEVRRLGMGPLLGNLVKQMQRKIDLGDRDPLKIRIHSTHDTGLAALCATLDVFDNQLVSAQFPQLMASFYLILIVSDGQLSLLL